MKMRDHSERLQSDVIITDWRTDERSLKGKGFGIKVSPDTAAPEHRLVQVLSTPFVLLLWTIGS